MQWSCFIRLYSQIQESWQHQVSSCFLDAMSLAQPPDPLDWVIPTSSVALCCRGEFAADSTLQEVVNFVDERRTDGSRPYLLRTPFPYRLLDTSQYNLTLQVSSCDYDLRDLPEQSAPTWCMDHSSEGSACSPSASISRHFLCTYPQ